MKNLNHNIENHDEHEIDILKIFNILFLYKFRILLIIFIAICFSYIYLLTVRPLYTARIEVMVEEKLSPIDLGEIFDTTADKGLQNEVEVIRSYDVLRAAIDELNFLKDPEFNRTAREEPAWRLWLRDRGLWPLKLEWRGLTPTLVAPGPPPAVELRTDEVAMDEAINILRGKIGIGIVKDSTILWINVQAWSPEKAAHLANTIADAYITAGVEAQVRAQRFTSDFIGQQVMELRQEVEIAEAAVQAFRSENMIIDEESLEFERFEEIDARYSATQALRQSVEEKFTQLEATIASNQDVRKAVEVLDDRRLNALLAAGYLNQLRVEIDQAKTRLWNDLEIARRREAALKETLDEVSATLEQNSANLVRLRQLEREAAASQVLFEAFLSRQKETSARQDLLTAGARVLNSARPPKDPSSPNKLFYYAIAIIFGGGLGFVLALLSEMSRNRFVSISELEAATGHTVLGTTPRHAKARSRRQILETVRKKPNGALAEAVRNLRTSILLANVDMPPKIVTLTSSVPEEGKSLTAVLLAMVTAQMGKRAIIVDVDVRRRTLHKTMDIPSRYGWISALNGSRDLEEVVKIDRQTGLHMLPVEDTRANAPDLLSSQAFDELLDLLRKKYDLVVLDAPPVLPVTDTRILAKKSDALIFIVKWNDTPKDVAQHGLASLSGIGAHINGLVLTQVDAKKQKQYGYGSYGSQTYGSYQYYRKSERYYTN